MAEENRVLKRKVLRKIYKKPNIRAVAKSCRLGTNEQETTAKIPNARSYSVKTRRRPRRTWLQDVEKDLEELGAEKTGAIRYGKP